MSWTKQELQENIDWLVRKTTDDSEFSLLASAKKGSPRAIARIERYTRALEALKNGDIDAYDEILKPTNPEMK